MEEAVVEAQENAPVCMKEIAQLTDAQCEELTDRLRYLLDRPAE